MPAAAAPESDYSSWMPTRGRAGPSRITTSQSAGRRDWTTLGRARIPARAAATRIATRPDATGRRSYGSYRAEVFASLLAVVLMLGVAVYVVAEAVGRIGATAEVWGAPFGSDLRLLTGLGGIPTVHYGPGSVDLAHAPDERVPLDQVEATATVLALLALDVCGAR